MVSSKDPGKSEQITASYMRSGVIRPCYAYLGCVLIQEAGDPEVPEGHMKSKDQLDGLY